MPAVPMPPGLTLIESADFLAIANGVLSDLAQLAPGPFDQPVVMVPHAAIRRYLTLAVARHQGVAASIDFPARLTLLDRLHGFTASDPWHRGALGWRIAAVLPDLAATLPEGIARTASDPDPFVRIGFATRLGSRLFDAMLHRPAMIAAWERGDLALRGAEDESWQAALWRRLVEEIEVPSLVARHLSWQDAVAAGTADTARWPSALLIAGDAMLPPLIRDSVATLATKRPVRWHLWVPTDESLDAERPRRRPAALAAVRALPTTSRESSPREHALADGASILGVVQRSLFDGAHQRITPTAHDASLQAHRCHSAIRELETLREQVAWLLGQDATLQPHDITLYLTDLDSYLSAVDAVFGTPEPGLPWVPYDVAGRPWRSRSTIGSAVIALLDALPGRFGRREILALLEHLPVRAAADIHGEQLLRLRHLVDEARIRWGLDGPDRAARHDVPDLPDGTWRHGIAQLHARYPRVGDLPDENADLIDRLAAWIERLAGWRTVLDTPRTASAWRSVLDQFLAEVVTTWRSDDAEALGELRSAVGRVLEQAAGVGPETPLPFDALRPAFEDALDQSATTGHLRGGLRVCRLEAGTVLPARVVLIAGLDDGRFPRGGGTPPWDILLQSRRDADLDPLEAEDPDPREDALDAFRDAVLSASDAVHLAWTGRSIMDNALRSPSVAVSELLDLVDQVLDDPSSPTPHEKLIIDEPLQPFAPRLFGEFDSSGGTPALQSAASRWATAARTVRDPSQHATPFLDGALAAGVPLERIALADLAQMLCDPVEWFWQRTLNLPKPLDPIAEADREPILPEDHRDLDIHRAVLDLASAHQPITTARITDTVELGYGTIAPAIVARHDPDRAVAVAAASADDARGTRRVELAMGGVTIEGELDRIGTTAMHVLVQYPVSARLLLKTWVRHLVLNATAGEGTPRVTALVGVASNPEKVQARFKLVDDPMAHLQRVVSVFDTLRREPVPLFPRAAVDVAEAMVAGKDTARAARGRWQASFSGAPGEGDSPIVARLFPGHELDEELDHPFWEAFRELTDALVVPMVQHLDRDGDA